MRLSKLMKNKPYISSQRPLSSPLSCFCSDQSNPKNKVPVLRAVANFFAHDVGTQVMHSHRKWVSGDKDILLVYCNSGNFAVL